MTENPKYTLGPDVDLDAEEYHLADGTRLTEQVAEQLAAEVIRRAGRPSLSGRAGHSPRVAFRLSEADRARADRAAEAAGVSVSQLAREALLERLAR